MKKTALTKLTVLVSAISLSLPSAVLACEAHRKEQAAKAEPKKMTIAQLSALQKKPQKPTVLDANSVETRTRMGIIPGSTMLSSAMRYDVAKELPAAKDAQLVFYCQSTLCTSSHKAAERAIEAGYSDVSVLSEGISGWKKAGQKTAVPQT